jgi:hypothetical protein
VLEAVAVAGAVEAIDLVEGAGEGEQLVDGAVGDVVGQPAGVLDQGGGVAVGGAAAGGEGRLHARCESLAADGCPGQHRGVGEEVRVGEAEPVGPVAPHREPGQLGPFGVEAIRGGQAIPHLPEIHLGLIEVEAVVAPSERGDADRAPGLTGLLDEVGGEDAEGVVLLEERVEHPSQGSGGGAVVARGDVDGVGLDPPEVVGPHVDQAVSLAWVVVHHPLAGLEGGDVPPVAESDGGGLGGRAAPGQIVPRDVHGEGRHVAGGQREGLGRFPPEVGKRRRYGLPADGRLLEVAAEGHVEHGWLAREGTVVRSDGSEAVTGGVGQPGGQPHSPGPCRLERGAGDAQDERAGAHVDEEA